MTKEELIKQLNLDKKISLLTGKNHWQIDSVGPYKPTTLSDGPHGLRKPMDLNDMIHLEQSIPSTCFPTASGLANTWNKSLLYEVGQALGQSAKSLDVSMILGPGVNLKRHPFCGRNFEYFSEDPVLTANLASSMIEGIQSTGVGACVKHYALNNQERLRMVYNAVIDERTLREFYLKPFELIVKQSKPKGMMTAYNRINGSYASENHSLINILRNEWGYRGLIMTDWGANNHPIDALKAGLNLEMPHNPNTVKSVKRAIKTGAINESLIDERISEIIDFIIYANSKKPHVDDIDQHLLAIKAAHESMVLLKNDSVLPLKHHLKIAVIGALAKNPLIQGQGSSLVQPLHHQTPYNCLKQYYQDQVLYSKGYDVADSKTNEEDVLEAIEISKQSDNILIFAGLSDSESEGYDRLTSSLPKNQIDLIDALTKIRKPLILIIQNGSPVAIPKLDQVDGLLMMYLSGEGGSEALLDILIGRVSPSGKLAETYPINVSDLPSHSNFGGKEKNVYYRERQLVGYRGLDERELQPQFAFGFGLTYTSFSYHHFTLYNDIEHRRIVIKGTIKNIGDMQAKTVIQVYVSKPQSLVQRVPKELKTFDKILIKPQEEIEVQLLLDYQSLMIYQGGYKLEQGNYEVYVGSALNEIFYTAECYIFSNDMIIKEERLEIDDLTIIKETKYTINSTLEELTKHWLGRWINRMISKQMRKTDMINQNPMIEHMIKDLPLRVIANQSKGKLSSNQAQGFIDIMNRHWIKGIWKLIRK